jgi:hypothetical protein
MIDRDVDREAAGASCKLLLAEAATPGCPVGSAHVSIPGLGRVGDGPSVAWAL